MCPSWCPLAFALKFHMPNSSVTEHSKVTPPMDIAAPQKREPHRDDLGEEHTAGVAAGRLPEDVYANTLPWWRAALRRKSVAVVEWESEVIAKWQVRLFLPLSSRVPNDRGRKSLILWFRIFTGACPVALARHVLCAYFDAWHAHVLSRVPSRVFLLWV